ncbi:MULTISPECIES: UDP-4-amino-4,6-dideoxy-N-acetyl-beta-L-altrosamine N-acetyltransferase [unclassified Pseudomonas]|uniref:UDP-4-amino-4, 6-dideoxy-N-acetyl-beta-L-altrosamine N-acetyltransferase n=1 Tax=unclassified Pseudomonas TaxID=196821 RepID=UPI00244C765B|nr:MULTISPECIES: UDP-4-amino-4,6-dideoxy-N-acetyl-beta-L-altrosamine N-acetyltransferase [unclassified Pseudomonas]MDG9925375.1 UDP-4-amino-4,6-dideoxy-N-acetyl-beta-L-altrosamine N-acetyltransferase [Pseudomonas sp. GD04045]MDH0037285.1 UDP-4-amino-4,6-dideoxy-N-acetyl-beta-L-altrosamine N-acetyltransferase [Pseudomonas sp. GD04019]
MLISKRIRLRAIEEADLCIMAEWRSNPEVYEYFYEYLPISTRQQKNWYEKQLQDSSEINFIVSRADDNKAIGTVSIYHIDRRNRKAEWGRLIIGDKEMRSGGYGAEIEALILQYSFEHLNLHKLYCEVLVDNSSVVELHKKFGFKQEGILRDHAFKAGTYADVAVLSMLDEEYLESCKNGRMSVMLQRMAIK